MPVIHTTGFKPCDLGCELAVELALCLLVPGKFTSHGLSWFLLHGKWMGHRFDMNHLESIVRSDRGLFDEAMSLLECPYIPSAAATIQDQSLSP